MKFLNKITAVFTATIIMASTAVAITASATDYTDPQKSPANTTDTSWYAGNDYCRIKRNNTSIYAQNASMIYPATISIYGRTTKYGVDQSVNSASIQTVNLTLPVNCQRKIRQLVNELGYSYVHIYFSGNTACGQWSPDSVGTYATLN